MTATEKQINFLTNLIAEREVRKGETPEQTMTWFRNQTIDRKQASEMIGAALKAPRRPIIEVELEGMHCLADGTIYKVQKAVHGSGEEYAKRLDVDEFGKVSFVFESGAIRKLSIATKMSLETAKEFGALYGTCVVCGRTLTDENSIAAGIGPICAAKF